ncbi:MAG: glycosyltransferase [Flavobacteriales bacterium]|nr:glycosyltransferase [Flavobacteriales bacterium]
MSVKDPIRIAIATPSANAWSETFIAAHIKRLQGVRVVLVDGDLPNRVLDGPMLLHRHGPRRILDHVQARFMGGNTQDLLRRRIAALLRRERIDVVLAEYGICADALVDPCTRAGVPLVAHFHGYDAHKTSKIEEMGHYRRLFAYAAAVVAVSRAMEQQLLALGAPREKLFYNCYGVDVDLFTAGDPGKAPPHFVAVGRFVEKKAPDLTLTAFGILLTRFPDARLTMVGQGPLWEACNARVQTSALRDRVSLPGVMSSAEIAELLRGARAFVQHSVRAASGDSEGTPLAVLEAMATGLPVIATRHAGIGDVVVHGEHGLLCAEFDVAGMAANMERLAGDAELAGRMGTAARTHVERNYRVEDSVAALQVILQRAALKPSA